MYDLHTSAGTRLGTHRAGIHPSLSSRAGFLLGSRSGQSARPGRPGPANQIVGANVVYEVLQGTATVARRILDLHTNLPDRLSFPPHFKRCKMPLRAPRHASGLKVGALVADRTAHGFEPKPVRATVDRRLMQAAEITLSWAIARWMTVHASRIGEHRAEFGKQRRRALIYIADRGKSFRRGQGVRCRFGDGIRRGYAYQNARQRRDRNENRRPQFGFHFRSPLLPNRARSKFPGQGQSTPSRSAPYEIAMRIGENYVAHSLVIFDITGAAAKMAVERFSDGPLELGARHRPFRQTLQQHLTLVQESGSAIAALERKMFDEALLQNRKLAILGVTFAGAERLAIEVHRRNDASRGGVACTLRPIDDHRATQPLRGAATEFRAGQTNDLAQKIVHRQFVAHVHRAVCTPVDREGECCHASAPFSMS